MGEKEGYRGEGIFASSAGNYLAIVAEPEKASQNDNRSLGKNEKEAFKWKTSLLTTEVIVFLIRPLGRIG